ncbi:MAG: PAS domain S-box protein [Pseudomonadota bacterium]
MDRRHYFAAALLAALGAGLLGEFLLPGLDKLPIVVWHDREVVLVGLFFLVGLLAIVGYAALSGWLVARRLRKANARAWHDLALNREMMRAILAASPDSIVIADERGRILAVNEAFEQLFGYRRADILGEDLAILMPAPERGDHGDYLRAYLETGEAHIIGKGREVECQRADGKIFTADLAVGEAKVDGRRIFTGIIRDATERKRIVDALYRQDRIEALGQLTGGVAHDFNNLLSIIDGNLEMLADDCMDDPDASALVADARDACESGAALVGQLLAFARRQPLSPRTVDLGDLVLKMEDMLRRSIGTGLSLSLSIDRDLWPVVADPTEVETALINLVINARDASTAQGVVSLRIANAVLAATVAATGEDVPAGDYVAIIVADTGSGMAPETLARIFEPFFTTKPVGSGTGLGLSRVYGFIKQSGGHILVESAPGKGSCFTLLLPRAKTADRSLMAPPPGAPQAKPRQGGKRVLVVEDDERVRRVVVRRVVGLGYDAVEAASAEEALRIAENAPCDILLTDIVMSGGMNGIELAGLLRSRQPALKVVLVTGYVGDRGLEAAGALPYPVLRKPYARADLARALSA